MSSMTNDAAMTRAKAVISELLHNMNWEPTGPVSAHAGVEKIRHALEILTKEVYYGGRHQQSSADMAQILAGRAANYVYHAHGGNVPMPFILTQVQSEVERAIQKHGGYASGMEGLSVIREELDELWGEVKADRGYQKSGTDEAIQVAATAVKYIAWMPGFK